MEFKHISIGVAEASEADAEDEIVIVAGKPEEDGSIIEATEIESHASVVRNDNIEQEEVPQYRGTSLEDIQSSRMPRTQIAVICVALVCLAAFIIWYIVTM